MSGLRVGPIGDVHYSPGITGAPTWVVQDRLRQTVSILDKMTIAQRADAVSGAMVLDLTAPIQAAIDHLESLGGGVLEWYDARITETLLIQSSNITIRPKGGNRLRLSGDKRYAFQIYPTSLNSIADGTGRPAGYTSGIAGQGFDTLMYDNSDATRLHDIEILGLEYDFTGGAAFGGRFIDAYSVDRLRIIGCKATSNQNTVTLWFCRDALVWHNDFTCGATAFAAFLFKTYGDVAYNSLRNGTMGVEVKGCYPQAGKTVYQAFDAGYEYWHPAKVHHNKVYNCSGPALHGGYYDNATTDISTGAPSGITLSQWFGEVWGQEICDNSVYFTGTPAVAAAAIRLNVNSRYFSVRRNVCFGYGIIAFGARDSDISENTIINPRTTSTAAIEVAGFTTGAVSRNSQRLNISRNRISGHTRNAIHVRGADECDIEENKISNGTSGFVQIDVDSTNASSASTSNHVLRNRIKATPADFAYPIRSSGAAGTVIEGNRAYGGWYNGNALDSDGFADNHWKRGVVSADTPNTYVGAAGTCHVGQNFGDQNRTTPVTGYADDMAVNGMVGGSAYKQAARMGSYFMWIDSTGDLRVKSSKPTLDTDGTIVGTQT